MKEKTNLIINFLDKLFPNAKCELVYKNGFELLVAVILSAQSTDKQVNKVTKKLFKKYISIECFSNADILEFQDDIKSIGLYRNKAKNILRTSNIIVNKYNKKIPNKFEELIKLPGVGRKTANVMLSVFFSIPAFAVDTHVERISKRLCLSDYNDSVITVEKKLRKIFSKDKWNKLHLQFILFGRNICKSKNPRCNICQLKDICCYYKIRRK